eukprot:1147858-Pelagomonas_calceolata.AAC.12
MCSPAQLLFQLFHLTSELLLGLACGTLPSARPAESGAGREGLCAAKCVPNRIRAYQACSALLRMHPADSDSVKGRLHESAYSALKNAALKGCRHDSRSE